MTPLDDQTLTDDITRNELHQRRRQTAREDMDALLRYRDTHAPDMPYALTIFASQPVTDGPWIYCVMTPSGESMPLTRAMLDSLGSVWTRLPRDVIVSITGPDGASDPRLKPDDPVGYLEVLTVVTADGQRPREAGSAHAIARCRAVDRNDLRLTILCERKPEGWPR